MHGPLAAVVLCFFAHAAATPAIAAEAPRDITPLPAPALKAAAAQTTTPAVVKAMPAATKITPSMNTEMTSAAPVVTAAVTAAAAPRAGGELIKAAAAGPRDDAPPSARATSRLGQHDEQPRRGTTAMLLAALALMSGIALRRFGAPDR